MQLFPSNSFPLLPLALLACGSGKGAVGNTDVTAIRVEPATGELEVRDGEPAQLQFEAWATFAGGSEEPIGLVSWESSNLSVGEIDSDGLFTSTDANGGITEISATHLGVSGAATLTLIWRQDLLGEGVDSTLVGAFEGASANPGEEPALLYPPDGVRVPRNLEGLSFYWAAPEGHNAARLRLRSAITDVSVYLIDESLWSATAELWSAISASNRNGEVEVTVTTGIWDGSTLGSPTEGPPARLTVNRLDATGSVLYWSTNVQGVMRIPFGSTESTAFWTTEDAGRCVGCHLVAQETDHMVMTYDGINGQFSVLDISDPAAPEQIVDPAPEERMTFKTVSPDGQLMIGTENGAVKLYETETGRLLRSYTELGDQFLTQPDWSPDGETVVFVRVTGRHNSEFDFEGGELVLFRYDEGSQDLTEGSVLVPFGGDWNYYYPAWSPDGRWLAFNRTAGSGYASLSAELWLISADGAVTMPLDMANGEANQQNSYPRWGPLPDDDILWLAWSSIRTYPIESFGQPQIWVTAIDTSLAETGVDPSSAPFWLPGQDPASDNHLPFWWKR
jgi:hypothetical protein